MKNYYQDDPEHSDEECAAQLTIRISKDNDLTFGCNWEPDEQGIQAISSIFYGMAYDDLVEQILNHLKAQCVLEDNSEEFLTIMQSIKDLMAYNTDAPDTSSGEGVAVPPRNVFKL